MEAQEREQEKEKIKQIIQERGIKHLFRFTPLENLDYILRDGLKSRELIEQERNKYPDAIFPDNVRADRRRNGICLSISFPNDEMFPRFRQRINSHWAIIVLDINLILEIKDRQISFFDTNSANSKFRNIDNKTLETATAFESLFAEKVADKYKTWHRSEFYNENMFYKRCPTSVQAEVMVAGHIETDYIRAVILDTKELASHYFDKYSYTYEDPDGLFIIDSPYGFFYDEKCFDKREDYLYYLKFWQ